MIVADNPIADFLSHSIMLLLIAIYIRIVLDMKTNNFIIAAIGIAAFITVINWMYFPGLRLRYTPGIRFIDYGCPMCRRKI
jgi:hypothetical protein